MTQVKKTRTISLMMMGAATIFSQAMAADTTAPLNQSTEIAIALTDETVMLPSPLPIRSLVALTQPISTQPSVDIFGQSAMMDDASMRDAAGGSSHYAIDLGALGINSSSSIATVTDNSADNSITGEIASNIVANNSGFTTVVFNSGNQVVFQNTVQVNVFTGN